MATAEQTGGLLATLFPQYKTQITEVAKVFTPSPVIAQAAQQPQQQTQKVGGFSTGDMLLYGGGGLLLLGALLALTKRRN